MIHPDTELRFISPEIGFGVVATKKMDFPGFRRQMIYIIESTGEVHVQAPLHGRVQGRSRQASH